MRKGKPLTVSSWLLGAMVLLCFSDVLLAKSARLEPLDAEGKRTWIIELDEPSLIRQIRSGSLEKTAATVESGAAPSGKRRVDLLSPGAVAYAERLETRFGEFVREAERLVGTKAEIQARYKVLLNGGALRLTESQADEIRSLPGVKSVIPNEIYPIDSDAGPQWIGAESIWTGQSGAPSRRGEGIIVGIPDTGINWDHSSFQDPSPDGYNHINPLGVQLGLCSDADVLCNDKLIGVYDFTDEGSKGKDTHFHGSHVASIAVGNPVAVTIEGKPSVMRGVAPRANFISYKVCREDDPDTIDDDEEGCDSADIIEGLEQALIDGVDVLNFSIGGSLSNPWARYTTLFLDLYEEGILAVTSGGNEGPAPASGTSPGVAPWLLSAAAATHTRVTGSLLKDMSGGDSPPPADLAGQGLAPVHGPANGVGPAEIVWAGDYGYPLCGTGEPNGYFTCDEHDGSSNPFPPGTFDDKIVVCERGTYGRIEKGYNVMEAGAIGYVLINSASFGESLDADNHCIPGIHVGYAQGQELKDWLTSGDNHQATLGPFGLSYESSVADALSDFSSQGPNPLVPDVLFPSVTAPGVAILGAGKVGESLLFVDGTSQASPHVAGGAALLLSVDPGLSPAEISSILQTTATTDVRSYRGLPATPFEMGSGRIQLTEALEAGLYLDEEAAKFRAANPALADGDPSGLNLPGLVNPGCQESCSFTRTVTDRAGGGNWTVSAVGFPSGAHVTISPSAFTLGSGASQTLGITFDLDPATFGDWVFGRIVLSSAGLPDQHLTAAIFSIGGDLPSSWNISDSGNGGSRSFGVGNLSALPNATFTAGGLVRPESFTTTLVQDPTEDDPFDSDTGVYAYMFTLEEGTLWFKNRIPSSTADDVDLFVGRDADGDGLAEEGEVLCESITPTDIENCDIFSPEPGNYWVLLQNYAASAAAGGDEVTLISAIVGPASASPLAVSGPGITTKNEAFNVRLSWDNVSALPGEQWLGAVGIGADRDHPANLGVIPVYYQRSGIAPPETHPLVNGVTHRLALNGNETHDRLFIDLAADASRITVTAEGADADQNNGLQLELVWLDIDQALAEPPFAVAPGNAPVLATASGIGGNPPSVTLSSTSVKAGRWYAVLTNTNALPSALEITAVVETTGTPHAVHPGLWEPISRPGLGQGYEYNFGGSARALIWYTYDEDGQPVWYISGPSSLSGNIWTAEILRVTNDGASQQLAPVGRMSVTQLGSRDALFSYSLYGKSGTERMVPLSALTCPSIGSSNPSYTGLWYRGQDGLGGASVLVNAGNQAQIHYLFDAQGRPRWLFAQDPEEPSPTSPSIPILQFRGYCAVCEPREVGYTTVGVLDRSFSSESAGQWTLDYLFQSPILGSVTRTDSIQKLTNAIRCE
jgi:hypothetical protein